MLSFRLPVELLIVVSALQTISCSPLLVPRASGSTDNSTIDQLPSTDYTITQNSKTPILRAAGIAAKQLGFLYGPPLAGGPYYPSGALGVVKDAADQALIQLDLTPELADTTVDSTKATADVAKYDGLQTLEDYTKLYDGEWKLTLPKGPVPGALTNYSQDLFFSMERLSASPYAVRRLNPSSDSLPFEISDSTAQNITGMTLQQLFSGGRLFYVDHSDQKNLTSTGRYAAAVDAYFYINQSSGDFLPLAIRTNVGSNLIYTPADSADDWLLAKIMYNVNDFWFAQWNHLAGTHEVVQIIWMAAIRTLSEDHPIFGVLGRLMYQVFAIQVLAETVLFIPGGAVDEVFSYTGTSAQDYTTNRYFNGGAGAFKSNYFLTDLENRGLINSDVGPELKSFPFYEDGSTIYNAIQAFITSFVDSYYSSDSVITADKELQAWVRQAQGPAKAIEFPNISTRDDLVGVLTQLGHLVSTAHHTVNTNELLSISSTLPFHTPSLYSPIPTTKGNVSVVSFLPPYLKVDAQLTVAALFARPLLVDTNRSLIHMFDDPAKLSLMNSQTQAANTKFMSTMEAFSAQVAGRTFDADGLSQGMPFVWQALDPNVVPYSIAT